MRVRQKGKSEFGRLRGSAQIAERKESIDIGLALLSVVAKPGVPLTQEDIAAWCGCARGYIHLIEKKALRKLRNRMQFVRDPLLREMMGSLFKQ